MRRAAYHAERSTAQLLQLHEVLERDLVGVALGGFLQLRQPGRILHQSKSVAHHELLSTVVELKPVSSLRQQ